MADDQIDAIYVATPHSEHFKNALLALDAGKPVLVEKAFARNAAEASRIIAAARRTRIFAAEAMWSRYLPHYDVVRRALVDGVLGDLVLVQADLGHRRWPRGPERLSRPDLAGGALLDLGVYGVSFAEYLMGQPTAMHAVGTLLESGVDATAVLALRGAAGGQASVTTSMVAATPTTATIVGTLGRIELDGPFYCPTVIRLLTPDGRCVDERDFRIPSPTAAFNYQAAAVARAIAGGSTEVAQMSHSSTVVVMEILDEARRQIGVVYPGELS